MSLDEILWCYHSNETSLEKMIVWHYLFLRILQIEENYCERFEPRGHFKSRLSLIVWVNIVLNRTVVVDSDGRFDNLCGSHLQGQIELYHVS